MNESTAKPKRLLDIAGLNPAPARLSESVLVIVDAQRDYYDGNLKLFGIEESLQAAAEVLAKARKAGTPVFHVVQMAPKESPIFAEGTPMAEIVPQLTPIDGETIVEKKLPSSFAGTILDEEIKKTGRNILIVIGYMTHMCVSTTVRAAIEYGYFSTIVSDATTTRDLPLPGGGVISAAELKEAELAALGDRFAVIVKNAAELPE